jgi:hypothetical protein
MAITTSAGDGVRVTSSAKNNGLLTGTAAANQFVLPDGIVATNNGQIGLSTLAGRLITIRRNEVDEETRYILSEHGLVTGTVGEDWDTPPVTGEAYDISYVIEDAATVTGLSLITKRTRDYSLGRLFSVGNAVTGTFSWFALLDGASLESDNTIGATDRAFRIYGDGRWDFGYQQGGAPVPGGYLISTANATGEYAFGVDAGGQFVGNKFFLTSVENNRWNFENNCRVRVDGFQLYKALYNSIWEGDGVMGDLVLQGLGASTDYMEIDESFSCDVLLLINSYGLYPNGLTTGSVLNYQSVGNTYDVQMLSQGTLLRFLNPTWDGTDPKHTWTAATGTFTEEYEFDLLIQNPSAVALQNARVYAWDDWLYDPINAYFQLQTESSDVNGLISDALVQREWVNNPSGGSGSTHGPFDLRILRYGQTPFETAFSLGVTGTNVGALDQVITLVDDGGVELSEAAADLVSGTVYEHGTGTAPGNLIVYDNGTIAFSAGDIVVGAASGATGTVRDTTGDTADGTLFIVDRNGTAFNDDENLQVGGVTNATANTATGTGGLDLDFHWEVRGSSAALDDLYSWQASKSAKASPDDWVLSMLRHRVDLFKRSGDNFWSERVEGEGVFLSERGAGNVLYLTSDGGRDRR